MTTIRSLTSDRWTPNRLVGVQAGWLEFLFCVMCKTFHSHSAFLHPGVLTKCQLRLTKIFRVGRLFTENNGTESVIAKMVILIDSCNRNKQTNCNFLLSKGFTSEKGEETLLVLFGSRAQKITHKTIKAWLCSSCLSISNTLSRNNPKRYLKRLL